MVNSSDLPENPSTGLQIKLNGGLLYQMFSHPGQMNTPHQFQNSATILNKLHEDKLQQTRSFRLSGGTTTSQTPEMAPVEDNERDDGNDFPSTVGEGIS